MQSDPMLAAVLELRLTQVGGDTYAAGAALRLPQSAVNMDLICGRPAPIQFDPEALLALRGDPELYGIRLSAMLFSAPTVREALLKARSQAEALAVRLRVVLRLDPGDPALHGLAWETLADPEGGGPLFVGERVVFSRYLESADLTPLQPRAYGALSALIAVAAPSDLSRYGLSAIDARGEADRAVASMGTIPARVLMQGRAATPTLNGIAAALRDGADILYLVCHGTSRGGQPLLWLETDDGVSNQVSGDAFVRMLSGLERRPLLVVLASCQSAGAGSDIFVALGPRLASVGVAAVLAMQGNLSMETAAVLLPTFFRELSRDGQIDRAAAVARAAVLSRSDWWLPVLFLRLYDGRIWADATPQELSDVDQVLRNRARMLSRVRNFWVRGVLEAAGDRANMLDLSLARRYDAVDNPWIGIINRPAELEGSRLSAILIVQIFDSAQGRLLILGKPGAGKTTLLLILARALIERAEHDRSLSMPVVFNLASWHERYGTLDAWLIEELYTRYDVLMATARGWVRARQVLPLLDGFDEVRADQRASCLMAINTFDRSQSMAELVVCSRLDEYKAVGGRLRLQEAMEVLSLSTSEVSDYLARGGDALANVRALYMSEQRFSELIETPLMLNVVSAAYAGDVHLPISISVAIWREYILGAYVRRMLERRCDDARYPRELVITWLANLAYALKRHRQSTFLIERIQPTWLVQPGQLLDYRLLVRLLSGICLGLVSIALILPVGGWRLGLASGLAGLLVWSLGWGRLRPWVLGVAYAMTVGAVEMLDVPPMSPALQLSYLLLAAVITGMGAWLSARQATFNQIDCIASMRWSWGAGLRAGLLAGSIGGLPIVLIMLLLTRDPAIVLAAGAAVGTIWGTLAGMAVGMKAREVEETSARPNEGIRRTIRTALWLAALAGPLFGIVGMLTGLAFRNTAERLDLVLMPGLTNIWLTSLSGLLSGTLLAFLAFGGLATLQHVVLRWVLYRTGMTPWKIANFLDYCAERALLRKVGGSYIFIHRTLLEYFAEEPEL